MRRELSIQDRDAGGRHPDRCPLGALWQYGVRGDKGLGDGEDKPVLRGAGEVRRRGPRPRDTWLPRSRPERERPVSRGRGRPVSAGRWKPSCWGGGQAGRGGRVAEQPGPRAQHSRPQGGSVGGGGACGGPPAGWRRADGGPRPSQGGAQGRRKAGDARLRHREGEAEANEQPHFPRPQASLGQRAAGPGWCVGRRQCSTCLRTVPTCPGSLPSFKARFTNLLCAHYHPPQCPEVDPNLPSDSPEHWGGPGTSQGPVEGGQGGRGGPVGS